MNTSRAIAFFTLKHKKKNLLTLERLGLVLVTRCRAVGALLLIGGGGSWGETRLLRRGVRGAGFRGSRERGEVVGGEGDDVLWFSEEEELEEVREEGLELRMMPHVGSVVSPSTLPVIHKQTKGNLKPMYSFGK